MKIKLDENISRHLKFVIIQKGHECVTAEDEGLLSKIYISKKSNTHPKST